MMIRLFSFVSSICVGGYLIYLFTSYYPSGQAVNLKNLAIAGRGFFYHLAMIIKNLGTFLDHYLSGIL